MIKRSTQVLSKLLTTRVAWPLLLSIALLCTVSILALRMSSPERAEAQKTHLLIGSLLLIAVIVPSYQIIGRAAYIIYGLVMLLLVGVLFTDAHKGGHRWIALTSSYDLQPSELAKIAFIVALAWLLRFRKNNRHWHGLIAPALLMALPMALILVEPDLGTALLFPPVLVAMLIASGARLRHLAIALCIAAAALPVGYQFLRPYQKQRLEPLIGSVQNLMKPDASTATTDSLGRDFQQTQSIIAIGSGGLFGLGLEGSEHMSKGILPEAYTDFIFAVVGTQWGFVGCLLVLLLYLAFYGAGLEIAGSTKDAFGRLLAVGIATQIVVQSLINIAMTVGLGPVVGVALPFLSYGGSSLVANMISAGILLNVSVRRSVRPIATSYPIATAE